VHDRIGFRACRYDRSVSENVITVVELSLNAEGARSRGPELAAWLLSAGVITPNRKRDDLWQPSTSRSQTAQFSPNTPWVRSRQASKADQAVIRA
jgi:hypothetical protein